MDYDSEEAVDMYKVIDMKTTIATSDTTPELTNQKKIQVPLEDRVKGKPSGIDVKRRSVLSSAVSKLEAKKMKFDSKNQGKLGKFLESDPWTPSNPPLHLP